MKISAKYLGLAVGPQAM